MFFLEGSVMGHCVDRLSFLLIVNKYLRDWMRAVLYLGSVHLPLSIPSTKLLDGYTLAANFSYFV
jgi:hypothetical protein